MQSVDRPSLQPRPPGTDRDLEQQLECFRRLEETEDLQLLLRKDDDCDCGERAKPKKRGECCYKRNAAGAHWSELIFK